MPCLKKDLLFNGFALAFQIVFVFAFLTIFFFVYVSHVEKKEFESQMNFIVDEIFSKDIEDQLFSKLKKDFTATELVAVISGIIDGVEFQTSEDLKRSISNVKRNNENIRIKAFAILGSVLAVLVLASIIMLILGYCIPIIHQVKEALWIVLFVALTEGIFLQVVAKNYISADPNKIKRAFGQSILNWLKTHK